MKCNYLFLIYLSFCFFNVTKLSTADLYCYVCKGEECEHINKDMLEYCGPERDRTTETIMTTDTTIPTTPPEETSINSTTPVPKTSPSTSPAGENITISSTTESTTISTTEVNNTESSTEESNISSSTIKTSPAPSNTPPTTISSTVPSSITFSTNEPNTTLPITANSTNSSTEHLTHVTTPTTEAATASSTAINSTSISSEYPTSVLPTTHPTLLTEEPSTISTNPSNSTSSTERTLQRMRKYVTIRRDDIDEFLVTDFGRIVPRSSGDDTRYACYSISLPENDYKIKRKHGCVQIPVGQSACGAVRNENNLIHDAERIMPDGCRYCLTSECNNGSNLRVSLIVLLATLFANYAMRIQ